jgi:hypothetical protein
VPTKEGRIGNACENRKVEDGAVMSCLQERNSGLFQNCPNKLSNSVAQLDRYETLILRPRLGKTTRTYLCMDLFIDPFIGTNVVLFIEFD